MGKWVTADVVPPPPSRMQEPDADHTRRPLLAAVPLSAASAALAGAQGVQVGALPAADSAVVDALTGAMDDDGVPLLGAALGAFHAATTSLKTSTGAFCKEMTATVRAPLSSCG